MPMNPRLMRPRQSGFNPASIAGLVGWWDFSDSTQLRQSLTGETAVAVDGDVVGWAADKSGNNRPMAANNDARRPVFKNNVLGGKSGIRFDGVNDVIGATTHSSTAPETQTWFGVFANFVTPASGSRRLFCRTENSGLYFNQTYGGASPNRAEYWARASSTVPSMAIGNAVYTLTYTSAAQCVVRQNNAILATVTTPNAEYTTATGLLIGGSTLAGGNALGVDCVEALIWHVALSDSQRRSVERYLASKYGLNLS